MLHAYLHLQHTHLVYIWFLIFKCRKRADASAHSRVRATLSDAPANDSILRKARNGTIAAEYENLAHNIHDLLCSHAQLGPTIINSQSDLIHFSRVCLCECKRFSSCMKNRFNRTTSKEARERENERTVSTQSKVQSIINISENESNESQHWICQMKNV